METLILRNCDMTAAADILKSGGLVAVPTETVYGLSADGLSSDAVIKIYAVKGRSETKPINLLVSGMDSVEEFCRDIPKAAYTLADRFWPGPLTMILRSRDNVPDIVTAGGNTVGVRCPDHIKTLEIIRLSGVPLATPSANISGQPSPKNAAAVLEYFNGKIECVVDGGQCRVGIESTIVDLTISPPKILRQGVLAKADIEAALNIEAEI